MMRLLASLWASPLTLSGIALARLGGCRFEGAELRVREYVAPQRGPWAWWFRRADFHAITIGEVIVYRAAWCMDSDALVAHELRHVEQYRRLGLLFPIAYASCSLLAIVMGRHPYREQWLEQDAQRTAGGGVQR